MALFSISMGVIFFCVAFAWFLFVMLTSQTESSGFAFRFILGGLPAILGMVLVVPSTFYRVVFVLLQKPEQTLKEKFILFLGLVVSVIYCSALLGGIFI